MTWCPCGQQVVDGDVETLGTTRIHKVAPWHRLVDGAAIKMADGKPEVGDDGEPIVVFEEPPVAEEEEA